MRSTTTIFLALAIGCGVGCGSSGSSSSTSGAGAGSATSGAGAGSATGGGAGSASSGSAASGGGGGSASTSTMSTSSGTTCFAMADYASCYDCLAAANGSGESLYKLVYACIYCSACFNACDGTNDPKCNGKPGQQNACDADAPDATACGDDASGCVACARMGTCSGGVAACMGSDSCAQFTADVAKCPPP